jgi:hypothetical protein
MLINACHGKTSTNGGLSVFELRKQLIDQFQPNIEEINKAANRKALEALCLKLLKTQAKIPVEVKPKITVKQKTPAKVEQPQENELRNACQGKNGLNGGLNVPEFRKQLIKKFPPNIEEINKATNRKALEALCLKLLKTSEIHVKQKTPVKVEAKIPVKQETPAKVEQTQENELRNACQGKNGLNGGLNVPEFRKQLIKKFPPNIEEINKATNRRALEALF